MKNSFNRESGMTMIELVSALILFILILGGLTLALNKATTLWSSSNSHQKDQETADLILKFIEDDLQHAVTDNAPDIDNNEALPTFLVDSEQANAGEVKIVLQFIRHRSYISQLSNNKPPALDAVFYTYYDNALFRHVIPLEYKDINNPEHIGKLLNELKSTIETPALHTKILDYLTNPTGSSPSNGGTFSVLAQNIHQPVVIAGIPEEYATDSANTIYNESFTLNNSIRTLPEYIKLESKVLPEYIFIALRIFNESEWATYQTLMNSADEATISIKEPRLGQTVSRRISFNTTRGSRLK